MSTVIFDTIRRQANDTPTSYCVCHPENRMKVIHLPKSETDIRKIDHHPGWWEVTIPQWLADEHDIC